MNFKHNIRKLKLPESFKNTDLILFVKFEGNETKLSLSNVGESLVPNPNVGKWCKKNANGYTIIDYSLPKARRYVTTFYFHPWNNPDIPLRAADIYKDCYQRRTIEPTSIQISLVSNEEGEMFFATSIDKNTSDNAILTAINVFIECFGSCYIDNKLEIKIPQNTRLLEWEILPPGKKPSEIIRHLGVKQKESEIKYSEDRMKFLESKPCKVIGQGINGSFGYFGYVYKNICIFECGFYGNATYVVGSANWEELSKKTKKELVESKDVLDKLIHNEKWFENISEIFAKYEG